MLGRELENMFPKRISTSSKTPLLKVRDLWPDGLLDPVDLDIFPGEILGLAGQLGSGTGEILSAIAGAHPIRGGSLEMDGNVFMPKPQMKQSKQRSPIAPKIENMTVYFWEDQ